MSGVTDKPADNLAEIARGGLYRCPARHETEGQRSGCPACQNEHEVEGALDSLLAELAAQRERADKVERWHGEIVGEYLVRLDGAETELVALRLENEQLREDATSQSPVWPEPGWKAGVGMPASMHLELFGNVVWEAFGHTPYLVGSAARGKTFRDVDVRLILPDDEYAEVFGELTHPHALNVKWNAFCIAFAELGIRMTGLPIDFQIDQQTEANEKYPGPRHALGIEYRAARAVLAPEPQGTVSKHKTKKWPHGPLGGWRNP